MISFFFNDTATTEIYTLSLHDALPISRVGRAALAALPTVVTQALWAWRVDREGGSIRRFQRFPFGLDQAREGWERSEEHTSELQSRQYLVCRLLLEKKKNNTTSIYTCL